MLRCHLITLRFEDGRVVAADERSRLYLARLVSAVGASSGLLAWRAEGKCVRLLVQGGARVAGETARRIEIGAQQVLGRGSRFERARLDPVEEEERLVQLHDELLLEGAQRRLLTASSLPDALGLRYLAPYAHGALTRCSTPPPAAPLDTRDDTDLDWALLPQSAAAVFGYEDLSRRYLWRRRALSAAVSLAAPTLSATAMSQLFRVSRSTVERAARRRPSQRLRQVILAQLRWRSRLGLRSGAP